MTTEAEILALLTGKKVFDGQTWRVYDAGGTEITDPSGVLWRGVHGALLWNANNRPTETVGGGSAPGKSKAPDTRYKAYIDSLNRDFERQSRIKQEDQLATEFLMALVHTGILDGHST